ncbi:hypothetical protein [Amphibacillus sediminis]|uniref:hypothetical protein n=1 Tax=Amphibacillus sediminis TaxID=360185 RepID=UPI0012EE1D39|nr:hypothetical protein [Amphibacillus sediminis]
MNGFNTSNGEDMKKYRRLKRYWKLILKCQSDLSNTAYKYYSLFGQRLDTSVVNDMLNYDPKLKANDVLYQSLLNALNNRDFEELELRLKERSSSLRLSYMKQV